MAETKNTKAKGNASNANKKGSVKKVNTTKKTNVQNKKKATNSKQSTTKKVNTQKNTEVKKKTANVATKNGQAKKSTASKNKTTVQNNKPKKANKVQTKKPIKVEVEKPKVNNVVTSVEELKEIVEPVVEEFVEEDKKVEVKENVDISESHDEVILENKDTDVVADDLDDERERKINRRIDIGILIVIIGLFILVLTTYLSSEIDLSINVTRILIISSLVVETIGMIIMVINIWKRK